MDAGEATPAENIARLASQGAPVPVEVRNRFEGGWSSGFEVVEARPDEGDGARFRLRRSSDGRLLPEWFRAEDIILRNR